MADRLVSGITGPALQVTELPASAWLPRGFQQAVSGVAIDLAHGEIRDVTGLGRAAQRSRATVLALNEFIERLVLSEPGAGGRARAAREDCPLAGRTVPAIDLATGAVVARPASDYYLHPRRCPRALRQDRPSSSGAAAGRSSLGALERALLELLERDALMVTWRYGLRWPPAALPESLRADARRLSARGLRLAFADLTGAHNVPIVVCLARGCVAGQPVRGVGCAADRTVARAARRALSEAAASSVMLAERLANGGPAGADGYADFADNALHYLDPRRQPQVDVLGPMEIDHAAPHPPSPPVVLRGGSRAVVGVLAASLRARRIAVYAADLSPRWLRAAGGSVVVARSPDLFPLELGPGSAQLAGRMRAHPCRSHLPSRGPVNLAPVPLA